MPANLTTARRLIEQNQLSTAELELNSILGKDKDDLGAAFLLAVVFAKTGRIAQAEQMLETLLQRNPIHVEATNWLGIIKRQLNQVQEAITLFERAIELGGDTVEIHNNLGLCYLSIFDPVSAGKQFMRAVELDHTSAQGYHNLGMALKMGGSNYEAFMSFKRATELDPNYLGNYIQVWKQVQQILNWQEGLPILESGLKRMPTNIVLMVAVAWIHGKLGHAETAEALYKQAWSKDETVGTRYAQWLQQEGRFDESVEVLKRSLRKIPNQPQAYYNLTVAKSVELDGKPLEEAIQPLLEIKDISRDGVMFLHYALAKIFDQRKDYEGAMRHFDGANEQAYGLYNSRVRLEPSRIEIESERRKRIYSKERLEELRKMGSESTAPIFIVGMIRSGTTLLNQVLSSHPQVESVGEQPYWQILTGRVEQRWEKPGDEAKDLEELEHDYLDVARKTVGDPVRFVDKMPTNFASLGLISTAFPNAKIIHLRRNPMDTAISIYTTFLGASTTFAYNQNNIVTFYREYLKAMEYWRTILPPDQMIEIDYEDLVSDKETVLRQLLEFCGLEWDDVCLSHEQNESTIHTPSLYTARQPVSKDSIDRWRRYEPWLGQLLELRNIEHPK